jgi:hypothetical protein
MCGAICHELHCSILRRQAQSTQLDTRLLKIREIEYNMRTGRKLLSAIC